MENYRCFSGNVLKWIGIFTMFVDHIGAVLINKILVVTSNPKWLDLYWICRYIGRIAFPLFCFTLVEGFVYTKNRKKYFGRMLLFAFISEVPFDLAVEGKWFSTEASGVMATFALGILVLTALKELLEPVRGKGVNANAVLRALFSMVIIGVAMWLAETLCMDYGAVGILSIVLFYLLRERRTLAAVWGCGALLLLGSMELPGLLAILPILLYNGRRGRQSKYFFYVFYPAHLLLLGLLAMYMI